MNGCRKMRATFLWSTVKQERLRHLISTCSSEMFGYVPHRSWWANEQFRACNEFCSFPVCFLQKCNLHGIVYPRILLWCVMAGQGRFNDVLLLALHKGLPRTLDGTAVLCREEDIGWQGFALNFVFALHLPSLSVTNWRVPLKFLISLQSNSIRIDWSSPVCPGCDNT